MNVVAEKFIAICRKIDKIKTGYNQGATRRWSVWNKKKNILVPNKDVDCSAAFAIAATMAGVPWDHSTGTSTRNIAQKARATGLYDVDKFDGNLSKVRPGGALLEPGHHIACMLDHGEMLSPEQTELHTTQGGKPGEQRSFEVRIRKAYKRRSGLRNGGWTYIINFTPVLTHLKRAIVAFGKGKNWQVHIKRMSIVAPHDGPNALAFLKAWEGMNKGMTLVFKPVKAITNQKLAIVVLGTKLNPNGTVTNKYVQRLQLALDQARLNPLSVVFVTGGKAYNGITEAEAGHIWLRAQGMTNNCVMETKAGSTIGNAKYTVPLLVKYGFQRYVLVSHASHLRRASIDFQAAILKFENVSNKDTKLEALTPLAVDDYAPKPVKTSAAVSTSDREAMASEVLAVLGL